MPHAPLLGTPILAVAALALTACAPPHDERREPPRLHYELQRWLPGLGEMVTIEKTPLSSVAVRAGGQTLPLHTLLQLDRKRFRDAYGAGSPALFDHLAQAEGDAEIPLVVTFAVEGLSQGENLPLGERPAWFRNTIAEARSRLLAALEGYGFASTEAGELMPVVFGVAPRSAVYAMIHHPGLTQVAIDAAPDPGLGAGERSIDRSGGRA